MAIIIDPNAGTPSTPDPKAPGGAGPGAGAEPKIVVDSDWKSQAHAEKERLAETERQAKQAAAAKAGPSGIPGAAGAGGPGEFPPPDFRGLVEMVAMQAIMYMGGVADPKTGRAVFDPDYSRHMIDLLAILEQKTRGNLTPEEDSELKTILNELRMRYVELLKMVAQQSAAGKLGVGAGVAGGMPGGNPGSIQT